MPPATIPKTPSGNFEEPAAEYTGILRLAIFVRADIIESIIEVSMSMVNFRLH